MSKNPPRALTMLQPSSSYDGPGLAHITRGPSGSAYKEELTKNIDNLIGDFKRLVGFSVASGSRESILESFNANLERSKKNIPDCEERLAEVYFNELKKQSNKSNSLNHDLPDVISKKENKFFTHLKGLIERDVEKKLNTIKIASQNFIIDKRVEDALEVSPILAFSKQNEVVRGIVMEKLITLSFSEEYQNNKNLRSFLIELINSESSQIQKQAKSSQPSLASISEDFKLESDKEMLDNLQKINSYLLSGKESFDKEKIELIKSQLEQYRPIFKDITKIGGDFKETTLDSSEFKGGLKSFDRFKDRILSKPISSPERVEDSKVKYSSPFFRAGQAFGIAEGLMKKIDPTFTTSRELSLSSLSRASRSSVASPNASMLLDSSIIISGNGR